MNNKLVNEFLDLRKECKGRCVMYITVHDDNTSGIGISTPKRKLKGNELDNFLKYLLDSSKFEGRIGKNDEHSIWGKLINDTYSKTFYKFCLSNARIEVVSVNMSDIVGKS